MSLTRSQCSHANASASAVASRPRSGPYAATRARRSRGSYVATNASKAPLSFTYTVKPVRAPVTPRSHDAQVDRQRLIDAYWEQYRLSTSGDRGERLRLDEWFWAWEDVERAVHDADGDVVELLVALAEAAPDGALGYVGAGPIENLIDRHGARFVDQIDDAARRS